MGKTARDDLLIALAGETGKVGGLNLGCFDRVLLWVQVVPN